MHFTQSDERYMKMALKLAGGGAGWVSPNPMVGAVVVRDGEIVGRGWHRRYGEAHAEVEALNRAGDQARGATLYVTLEPCNHQGLTPPCTQAILKAGIARVVIASRDPNPNVTGGGAAFLRKHGLKVETGLLEAQARQLNEAWFKWVETGLPFVIAKAACSLDGRTATATGESQWITGEASRLYGHRLRHMYDAILVGIGTVLADDPQLTTRLGRGRGRKEFGVGGQGAQPPASSPEPPPPTPYGGSMGIPPVSGGDVASPKYQSGQPPGSGLVAQASSLCTANRKPQTANRGKDPIRIILDSRLKIPLTARVLHLDSPAPTWIASTGEAPKEKIQALQEIGAEVLVLPEEDGRVALKPLLELLGQRRVQSVLVEGGAETLGSFFDQRLVDKFYFFYAPKILGGKNAYPAVAGKGVARLKEALEAKGVTMRRLGPDILLSGYL
jgi:riboflavin-specific deaminase-like protein